MSNYVRNRLNFITYPTKFHEMPNLQKALGCKPRIFVKRDDMTEVGMGGNKTRKLDYVMYDAVMQNADCIVTWAGAQSNHIRQTIAYANKLGKESHVVVNAHPSNDVAHQGNQFIFDLMGAKIYYEPVDELCDARCLQIANQLNKQGKKTYYVPIGASTPLGTLGYIDSAKEISQQAAEIGITVSALFVASGSAGTQAGLEIGCRLFMPHCKVNGVSVSRCKELQQQKVAKLVNETTSFFDDNIKVSPLDIIVHDDYFGAKYAVSTPECVAAIKLVAQTEGIVLDPVYTGKAMSGMLDLLKKGKLDNCENVVFVHTGGNIAIFNFTQDFNI